jgi:hypothetical protein
MAFSKSIFDQKLLIGKNISIFFYFAVGFSEQHLESSSAAVAAEPLRSSVSVPSNDLHFSHRCPSLDDGILYNNSLYITVGTRLNRKNDW